MKTRITSLIIVVAVQLALLPSARSEPELGGQQELEHLVNQFLSSLKPEVVEKVKNDRSEQLFHFYGKPGALELSSKLSSDGLPKLGIYNKEILLNLIFELTESKIRDEPIDLLGALEETLASYSVYSNFPKFHGVGGFPSDFRVTDVLFKVSIKGEISTTFVARAVGGDDILVADLNKPWRAPTPYEKQRIEATKRAIRLVQ